MKRILLFLLASFFSGIWAFGQGTPRPDNAINKAAELRPGELTREVRCAANAEQSYALYLPKNYTASRKWPVVYVFDPAARGSVPLELMKEAAEKYGYVLTGSNNSRNGPSKPEGEAAQAWYRMPTRGWLSTIAGHISRDSPAGRVWRRRSRKSVNAPPACF